MSRIHLIWAQARGGVIGRGNTIPWRLPEDMAHFKALTMGHPVLMGRKTWDSLPPRFRPLPGRRNIVITRDEAWQGAGAERAGGLPQALALCADAPDVWIVGGAQIYAQALPLAQHIVITEIGIDVPDGDAFAPAIPPGWTETTRQAHVAADGRGYCFVTLQRQQADVNVFGIFPKADRD